MKITTVIRALKEAEAFMAGFEGDELQEGIGEKLHIVRGTLLMLDEKMQPARDYVKEARRLNRLAVARAPYGDPWGHLQDLRRRRDTCIQDARKVLEL